MSESSEHVGLGNQPKDQWPAVQDTDALIDRLKPRSDYHDKVKEYLLYRIKLSERAMSDFYARWNVAEMKLQAYINLEDYEKVMKDAMDNSGAPAKAVSITVPYAYATLSTIVTYLIHTFGGRKPMFQVGTYGKHAENARSMETLLQYNADHTRLLKDLFQFFNDGELYGLGVMWLNWRRQVEDRTVWVKEPRWNYLGINIGTETIKTRQPKVVFEGTESMCVDPFMFFPDPRVPISEVASKGEFVDRRTYTGKHELKSREYRGFVKYIDDVPRTPSNDSDTFSGRSNRSLKAFGESHPGRANSTQNGTQNFYQIDEISIEVIPRELGISDSTKPEKWVFQLANKAQIISAERLNADHGKHPVVINEPYTFGYGFGNPGAVDYLGPIQDTVSWFVNSHIHNIRASMNNMFIVDPSMIEMQDLKRPEPGKLIRLKRASYGVDVRTAVQQLNVADVTQGHIKDLDLFIRLGDAMSMVNDNIRGLQDAGGRKTATEVRTSGEAAASRLASHARLISAQSIVELTEMWSLNYQQHLSSEFTFRLFGDQTKDTSIHVTPESITGDFYYPVHDGTLPMDRVAMLDVWKEIFVAVLQDQQLRGTYDVPKLFEWIAELGGAKNISSFKLEIAPSQQIENAATAGNIVQLGGQTPGTIPQPGNRAAEGV